jgi:hypothetical protein
MTAVRVNNLARRAAQFIEAHPDVHITRPGDYRFWVARCDGMILAAETSLAGLLDDLEELLPGHGDGNEGTA